MKDLASMGGCVAKEFFSKKYGDSQNSQMMSSSCSKSSRLSNKKQFSKEMQLRYFDYPVGKFIAKSKRGNFTPGGSNYDFGKQASTAMMQDQEEKLQNQQETIQSNTKYGEWMKAKIRLQSDLMKAMEISDSAKMKCIQEQIYALGRENDNLLRVRNVVSVPHCITIKQNYASPRGRLV